jgi:hypothetical protein
MKILRFAVPVLVLILAMPLAAQEKKAAPANADETNMQILRDKIKADKKAVVASNMQLSDAESRAFWPIYDEYQKDLTKLNQRIADLVKNYADAWNKKALTSEVAKKLTDESLAIEASEASMRKAYADKLGKAVSATTTARYLQIEGKIRAIIRYEMAASIPLVP